KTVTVPITSPYTSATDLAAAIQTAAESVFPALPPSTFTVNAGKVTYTSSVSIGQTKNGANAALGIDISNMSNKVDLNAKISDIKGGFKTTLDANGTGNDIEFSINNQYFRFNSKEVSINDIIKKVNANTQINATMKYDVTTNSFKIQSKATGATDKLTVEDKTGNFMEVLGIVDAGTKIKTNMGTDASVTIKNGSEPEITIVRPSNVFTYDGLTFDIKKDFTATDTVIPPSDTVIAPIKVTVSGDTTKTYDFIKAFVDKYNEIIGKLNDKISEKKYKDYVPLTSDQEAAMTEDQIKAWEAKAKSGLLKNDSTISDILTKLRSSL
ncbi:MAG: flagellar filament capping protein FliD, partial [Ruminiclostridium sp.]